jgi:putative oxidoreductase
MNPNRNPLTGAPSRGFHTEVRPDPGHFIDESAENLSQGERRVSLGARILTASILLETLWFKFTGHPESMWIFRQMNMESWGRYGQGVWELTASVLLFVPRFRWVGALLALGAMGSAIASHLTVLGIAIQGDHGLLFGMACTAFLGALATLWIHQQSIPNITRLDDAP